MGVAEPNSSITEGEDEAYLVVSSSGMILIAP